jgi:hypothetical protein
MHVTQRNLSSTGIDQEYHYIMTWSSHHNWQILYSIDQLPRANQLNRRWYHWSHDQFSRRGTNWLMQLVVTQLQHPLRFPSMRRLEKWAELEGKKKNCLAVLTFDVPKLRKLANHYFTSKRQGLWIQEYSVSVTLKTIWRTVQWNLQYRRCRD